MRRAKRRLMKFGKQKASQNLFSTINLNGWTGLDTVFSTQTPSIIYSAQRWPLKLREGVFTSFINK